MGSIFVDNDKANKSIDETDKKGKGLAGSFGSVVGVAVKVGAAVGAAGGALFAMATKAGATTDRIDKMSQRLGMSREAFQEWDFILSQNGVSMDSMQTAMKSMTASMASLAEGGAKGKETLGSLGITVNDLKNLKQEEIFEKAVIALQGMDDGYEKARLAQQLFGKQGQEMLPMLNSSKGGIEELKDKAHELGLVLGDEAIDAGVKFTDTLDQLKRMGGAVFTQIGTALIPIMLKLAEWVMAHMPQIQAVLGAVFNFIAQAIQLGVEWVGKFIDWVQQMLGRSRESADGMMELFSGLFEALQGFISAFVDVAIAIWNKFGDEIMAYLQAVWNNIVLIFGAAISTITNVLNFFAALFRGNWKGMWDAVKAQVQIVWTLITGLIKNALNFILLLFGTSLAIAQATVANSFDAIAYKIQSAMSYAKTMVLKAVDAILAGFEKLFGWIPKLGGVIAVARDEISNMIDDEKVTQSMRTFERSANQASYAVKIQEAELKKLEVAMKDASGATANLTKLKEEEKTAIEKSTQATKDATEAQKKAREETVKHLDALGDAIKKALVKRYESEEKLQIDSLTKQASELKKQTDDNIKQYDREYAAKLKLFDAETSAEMKALQDQIDAINAETEAEERALKEQEYQARLSAKERALAEATSSEEILKITAEMDEMIAAHEREQLLESRKQQIAAIKDEMDLVKSRAEEKREAMRLELEEKKEHEKLLNEEKQKGIAAEMDAVKNHYAALKTEEALQHTARKLATDKNNKEIIALLKTFNPEWQNAGQGFGNSLLDGLNSTKKSIEDAVRSTLSLVGNVASPRGSESIPGMATGGKTLQSGRVIVGEAGPEILDLPAGATVTPLDKVAPSVVFERGAFEGAYIMDDYSTDRLMDRIFARLHSIGGLT